MEQKALEKIKSLPLVNLGSVTGYNFGKSPEIFCHYIKRDGSRV